MSYFQNLSKCYLIAEIGVNHNGDMDLCHKLIDAAAKSGADAVKFQTFKAETLAIKDTPKVNYQYQTTLETESHYEMLRKLELKLEDHETIKRYCEHVGVDFISTPYDINSAVFLDNLGVKMFKTASADIVDYPLHNYIAQTGKPSIISTGMASLGEVEKVIDIYIKYRNDNFILLHAVSNYPCTDDSLNLCVMKTMGDAFRASVGYSDHSKGKEAAIISLAYGAKVIEKHFTLDKTMVGPDHSASSTPSEFASLVHSLRRAEKMFGSPIKRCQQEEYQMSQVSRKSIVAACDIQQGEIISPDDLTMKRPGTGLNSYFIKDLISKKARRTLKKDDQIKWSDIE